MDLQSHQRSFLMKRAQKLKPIVYVGKAGPESGVVRLLSEALAHHELVKVKFNDFKEKKREITAHLAHEAGADVVQIIGNVAVLYKMQTDPEKRRVELPASR